MVVGLVAGGLLLPGLAAQADTRPPVAGTPVTVSTDVLPTVQMDGVAWTQIVVGNTVYVGGDFDNARPAGAAAGTQLSARSNFLAYNLQTGALLPFAPAFNAQVRALAVSPDQKTLYVGGQFTTVNGSGRYRIAAFDLTNGNLKGSFAPVANSTVYGIATRGTKVYVGGYFSSINNTARNSAAALEASTGALTPFVVNPAGGHVRQFAISPDGNRVVLGGNFTSLNGSNRPGYGLAMVDGTTGGSLPMPVNNTIRNAGTDSAILSLASTTDGFYGSGYRFGNGTGNLEGSFRADWNGNLVWIEDCHGDTYSIAPTATDLYVAGHPHDCSPIGGFPDTVDPVVYHRGLAITLNRTGTVTRRVPDYFDFRGQPAPSVLNWYPDINSGTITGQDQGSWTVAASGDYVVYGGEFTKVNGKAQQGLVRFARTAVAPNTDGPVDSGAAFNLQATASALTGITTTWKSNWDRDNIRLTYKVTRNGTVVNPVTTQDSTFWNRPTLTFRDTNVTRGTTYSYQVTATDPLGNSKASSVVSVTAR